MENKSLHNLDKETMLSRCPEIVGPAIVGPRIENLIKTLISLLIAYYSKSFFNSILMLEKKLPEPNWVI